MVLVDGVGGCFLGVVVVVEGVVGCGLCKVV